MERQLISDADNYLIYDNPSTSTQLGLYETYSEKRRTRKHNMEICEFMCSANLIELTKFIDYLTAVKPPLNASNTRESVDEYILIEWIKDGLSQLICNIVSNSIKSVITKDAIYKYIENKFCCITDKAYTYIVQAYLLYKRESQDPIE